MKLFLALGLAVLLLASCESSPPQGLVSMGCQPMPPLTTDQVGHGFDYCNVLLSGDRSTVNFECGWWPVHQGQRKGKIPSYTQTVTLKPADFGGSGKIGGNAEVNFGQTKVQVSIMGDGQVDMGWDSQLPYDSHVLSGPTGDEQGKEYLACVDKIFKHR